MDIRACLELLLKQQLIAKLKIPEESKPTPPHFLETALLWLPPVRYLCTKQTHDLQFHKFHLHTVSTVAKGAALLLLPMLISVQTKNTMLTLTAVQKHILASKQESGIVLKHFSYLPLLTKCSSQPLVAQGTFPQAAQCSHRHTYMLLCSQSPSHI